MKAPSEADVYDVAIAGGGLGGLSLSILLAKNGWKVILFEKEKYPFHKVCGEYISMESWNFLQSLGVSLATLALPGITKVEISSPNGTLIQSPLSPGGFGISRYKLDNELKNIAEQNGVIIVEESKVSSIIFNNELFKIDAGDSSIHARIAIASFGKRSNLDIKWKRDFTLQRPDKLNNYIGVKYHVNYDHAADTIALHNFKNGYCGISKIEDNASCLCYLTTAKNLFDHNNSIKSMEKKVLCKNPFLQKIFSTAQFLFSQPVTISQISFEQKELVYDHILMVGDAAGMITPLCGNGMSIAMHAAKLAYINIDAFLKKEITRHQLERGYAQQWSQQFERRMQQGRRLQKLFGSPIITNVFISAMKPFPALVTKLIKTTHGESF